MKKYLLFTLYFLLFTYSIKAQQLFYQNTYKGGVTADGASYTDHNELQPDTVNFQLHIPISSTIKKAFLFTERYLWLIGSNPSKDAPLPIKFNGTNLIIDSSDITTPVFNCVFGGTNWICYKDVTGYMQYVNNTLITPDQVALMSADHSRDYVYSSWYLVVLYNDNTMQTTNTAIILNNQSITNNNTYNLTNLNAINNANDVGLSIWADQACSLHDPGTQIQFSLQSTAGTFTLGTLDENKGSGCAETLPGSFYYENNTLHGLVDDTTDSLIGGTDALANIKHYIINNTTNFNLISSTIVEGGCSSLRDGYTLAYSTPCPARSNKDTTMSYNLCSGSNVQLNGTSVGTYSWSATNNSLNNYNIPNPIANPTVTTTYIALVDSNGCKHTEHFKVNVHTVPKIDSVKTSQVICGSGGGGALVYAHAGTKPYSYNIGAGNQSSASFPNLQPITYTITLTDSANCTAKKTFTITEINIAQVNFTFTPTVICVNEPVQFTKVSTTTNLQTWSFVLQDSSNTANPMHVFTDTGTYQITLIAWRNQRQCSDTVTKTLVVKDCPLDSIKITVPNIFSPNADGINDTWQLIVYNFNYTVSNYDCTIYDRWGIKVFETNNINTAWDGKTTSSMPASAGTYFYIIKLTATNSKGVSEQKDYKGYLELVR